MPYHPYTALRLQQYEVVGTTLLEGDGYEIVRYPNGRHPGEVMYGVRHRDGKWISYGLTSAEGALRRAKKLLAARSGTAE